MSNRHYWPEPPPREEPYYQEHLVEHANGEVRRAQLWHDGRWHSSEFRNATNESLTRDGWVGVRTPFDEEAERAAFEAEYRKRWPNADGLKRRRDGEYEKDYVQIAWEFWLAAKRHERGL